MDSLSGGADTFPLPGNRLGNFSGWWSLVHAGPGFLPTPLLVFKA